MKRDKALKRDGKGYVYRNLGWLPGNDGKKPAQPKFLLSRDDDQAIERLRRLERLWDLVKQHHEAEYSDGKPVWDKVTLAVAKAIARGERAFVLPRRNQRGENDEDTRAARSLMPASWSWTEQTPFRAAGI